MQKEKVEVQVTNQKHNHLTVAKLSLTFSSSSDTCQSRTHMQEKATVLLIKLKLACFQYYCKIGLRAFQAVPFIECILYNMDVHKDMPIYSYIYSGGLITYYNVIKKDCM